MPLGFQRLFRSPMAAPVLGAATLRTLTAENARLREELHRTATAVRQCVLTAVSASLTPRRLESRQQTSLSHDDRSVDDSVHPTHLSHMMQIRFIDVDASQAASSSAHHSSPKRCDITARHENEGIQGTH